MSWYPFAYFKGAIKNNAGCRLVDQFRKIVFDGVKKYLQRMVFNCLPNEYQFSLSTHKGVRNGELNVVTTKNHVMG